MSKSLGNLITIKEFLAEHDAAVLRMMVLGGSYRGPLTFGDEAVESATRGLDRLRGGLRPALPGASGLDELDVQPAAAAARTEFEAAMDDDFNSSAALAVLFELVRQINQRRDSGASDAQLQPAQTMLLELAGVLGLRLEKTAAAEADPAPYAELYIEMAGKLAGEAPHVDEQNAASLIEGLLAMRQMFRAQKQWEVSDQIRDRLAELGVIVEDSAGGSSWHWA
jgi:cysteinyl-tRNA synthetase